VNQQNQDRRRHVHRSRRGPDRRGLERRNQPAQVQGQGQEPQGRDGVDVEQIMRDIRTRIAQRHGIELSNQQIQELAARRLEAILDPRAIKPALLDELRRGAAAPIQPPPPAAEPPFTFDDNTLFESHNGFVRLMRRLLAPLLKLLFNPAPIAAALGVQSRLNVEAAQRETARAQQQAEWNALHYEILQRLVTEVSRGSIEMQALTMKIEALGAKVDFNERRVRGIEGVVHQPRTSGRSVEPQAAASASTVTMTTAAVGAEPSAAQVQPQPGPGQAGGAGTPSQPGQPGQPGEGRRRRRRRRGRRGGTPSELAASPNAGAQPPGDEGDEGFEDGGDDDAPAVAEELAATASTDVSPAIPEPESVQSAPAPEPVEQRAEPVAQTAEQRTEEPVDQAPAQEREPGPTGHE
jgi:hypothetical protein